MLSLILPILFSIPVIDGHRTPYDTEIDFPCTVGWSQADEDNVYLKIEQVDILWSGYVEGTQLDLAYTDVDYPLHFFVNGEYQGVIIPEPCTLLIMLSGLFVWRIK